MTLQLFVFIYLGVSHDSSNTILLFCIASSQTSLYLGTSHGSSSTSLAIILVPYVIFSIREKHSSKVLTLPSIIKSKFGIPRSLVMGWSCILGSKQEVRLQGGVSMKPSSSNPSLHLVYCRKGTKGCKILGNKQVSLNLSTIADLMLEILEVIPEIRFVTLEYIAVKGDILVCTVFNVSSIRMIGRGHE